MDGLIGWKGAMEGPRGLYYTCNPSIVAIVLAHMGMLFQFNSGLPAAWLHTAPDEAACMWTE